MKAHLKELMDELFRQLEEEVHITSEEREAILENVELKEYPKGALLLQEGQIAHKSYHNFKGVVRQYYLIDGEERTTAFYTEGDSISSSLSYVTQAPATHYLECVEDCILMSVTFENEQKMFARFPKMESLCRVSSESNHGRAQEMMASYITKSPEQRYLHLLKTRPDLVTRVPQYQLASYLGVKPESLSRIRKRLAMKHA